MDEPTTRAGYSNDDPPTGFALGVVHNNTFADKYSYAVWAEGKDKNWKTYDFNQYYDYATKNVTGIKKADFLAMPKTQVAPTQSGINVEFKHTMSKINLTIELGDEYEFAADVDKKIKDVKIDGSVVKASYEIYSSNENPQFSFGAYSGDPTPISPLLTATTPYSKTDGTIKKATASYEAILIPQPSQAESSLSASGWMASSMSGHTTTN